ncbi:MAG: hypothetical protein ACOH2F_13090 [Cellulomonas sp.]
MPNIPSVPKATSTIALLYRYHPEDAEAILLARRTAAAATIARTIHERAAEHGITAEHAEVLKAAIDEVVAR